MNIINKKKRDLEIASFLCTQIGVRENGRKLLGKPKYHTIQEASDKYDICYTQIARIKAKLIGIDIDGIRRLKE